MEFRSFGRPLREDHYCSARCPFHSPLIRPLFRLGMHRSQVYPSPKTSASPSWFLRSTRCWWLAVYINEDQRNHLTTAARCVWYKLDWDWNHSNQQGHLPLSVVSSIWMLPVSTKENEVASIYVSRSGRQYHQQLVLIYSFIHSFLVLGTMAALQKQWRTLSVSLADAILTISMNRPKVNAMSEELLNDLNQAFDHASNNNQIRGVHLRSNMK